MYANQLRTLVVHCQMALTGDKTYGTPREITRDVIRATDRIKELVASQKWELSQ